MTRTEVPKKDITTINPASLDMDELKQCATDILAGEYTDEKGIADEMISAIRSEYANKARQAEYHNALASGNPMVYLCEHYHYKTIAVKKSDGVSHIVDDVKEFDLLHALKEIPGGIGASKHWVSTATELYETLIFLAKVYLGDEALKAWVEENNHNKHIQDLYKAYVAFEEDNKNPNPVSVGNIHKAIENAVQGMLGKDVHISSHDTKFVLMVSVKNNKKSESDVSAGKLKGFLPILLKINHRIVTGKKGYHVATLTSKKR